MALKITNLYNKNFFSQLGNEYVCTGFMYDMATTNVASYAEQLSSYNLAGVMEEDTSTPIGTFSGGGSVNTAAPGAGSGGY